MVNFWSEEQFHLKVRGLIKVSNRYLTKSRFKIGLECPTKLYYEGNKEYANQNIEDSFLMALAEGGFQVGELAKYYYAGGHMIGSLNYAESLAETKPYAEDAHHLVLNCTQHLIHCLQ